MTRISYVLKSSSRDYEGKTLGIEVEYKTRLARYVSSYNRHTQTHTLLMRDERRENVLEVFFRLYS